MTNIFDVGTKRDTQGKKISRDNCETYKTRKSIMQITSRQQRHIENGTDDKSQVCKWHFIGQGEVMNDVAIMRPRYGEIFIKGLDEIIGDASQIRNRAWEYHDRVPDVATIGSRFFNIFHRTRMDIIEEKERIKKGKNIHTSVIQGLVVPAHKYDKYGADDIVPLWMGFKLYCLRSGQPERMNDRSLQSWFNKEYEKIQPNESVILDKTGTRSCNLFYMSDFMEENKQTTAIDVFENITGENLTTEEEKNELFKALSKHNENSFVFVDGKIYINVAMIHETAELITNN